VVEVENAGFLPTASHCHSEFLALSSTTTVTVVLRIKLILNEAGFLLRFQSSTLNVQCKIHTILELFIGYKMTFPTVPGNERYVQIVNPVYI
jgi:hypothetical protein